jgi:KUP system potassium uptake protein
MILVGVVILVLVFQSSSNLASAYGIAVNTSMIVDTILATIFFWKSRTLPVYFVIPALVVIFVIEATFLAANGLKLAHGGYMPVLLGATIILLMVTWMRGRRALTDKLKKESVELVPLLESLERRQPTRVAGAAVFLQTDPIYAPSALMHNLKHNEILHERYMILTVVIDEGTYVSHEDRIGVRDLGGGFYRILVRYGFMQEIDIPAVLKKVENCGPKLKMMETSFFLSRQTLLASDKPGMAIWREHLFSWMMRNAESAMDFFKLPTNRVVELGSQVEI